MEARRGRLSAQPLSIYEVHLGSWRRNTEEKNRSLSYLELAETLLPFVMEMGFTHVELMPVAEHPSKVRGDIRSLIIMRRRAGLARPTSSGI